MKKFYILLIALFMASGASAQWFPQNSGTSNRLNSVYFTNAITGYVTGDGEIGTMLKTTDGGANWVTQNLPYPGTELHSVYFPKEDTGYGGGSGGWTVKTTDGGLTWTEITYGIDGCVAMSCGCIIFSLFFTDVSTGFSVGSGRCSNPYPTWDWGYIYKTNDGGVNWSKLYEFDDISLSFVFFVNDNIGYVVGELGTILKTTDAGINWILQSSGTDVSLSSVYFVDEYIGYTVGEFSPWYYMTSEGIILKTTDGGLNWIIQKSCTDTVFNSVYFTDENKGYTVGKNGIILSTDDGGVNWFIQNSGTTDNLSSVYFTSADTGYIVGENGTILKTTNGGLPVNISDHQLATESLKIYPNPASNQITISMPTTPLKNTFMNIYNISGQQLIQRQITEQQTVVDMSGLVKGIYFVRVIGDDGVSVGKVVKQ